MKFWNGMGVALVAFAMSAAAFAQGGTTTTPPPATCTTAPTTVTALNLERVVTLNNVLTTLTPNAPADVLAAIAGGSQEIHELLIYNAQANTITSTVFLMPAGSTIPTPLVNITAANTIAVTVIAIKGALFSCTPVPSLLAVGEVVSSPGGIFGSLVGAPVALSIGYTTDNPPKINNAVVVLAGLVVEYSASATGTLTFPPPSGGGNNGGGGTGTGPTALISFRNGTAAIPNSVVQVNQSPFLLSGANSTGTAPLTYAWSTSTASPVVFLTPNAATTEIQFPGTGDYVVMLTVTDASGNSNTEKVTFQYTGRPN